MKSRCIDCKWCMFLDLEDRIAIRMVPSLENEILWECNPPGITTTKCKDYLKNILLAKLECVSFEPCPNTEPLI